jgi:hypothetical protein
VEFPIDGKEESHFVLVDLQSVQPGDLAPSPCRIIAVLKVFGSQNERRKEHAATALQSSDRVWIIRLFHCKIVHWHMLLDQN